MAEREVIYDDSVKVRDREHYDPFKVVSQLLSSENSGKYVTHSDPVLAQYWQKRTQEQNYL